MSANFIATPSLPAVTLSAAGSFVGTGAEFSLPAATLAATLESNYWRAEPILPTASLSASMLGGAGLTFEATLRPVSLTATLLQDAILSASPVLPKISLSTQFIPAVIFTAAPSLPVLGLSGQVRSDAAFVATFTLPSVQLSAEIQQAIAETYRTWALNLRKNALTEYDNFDFNSYAVFNGQVLACSAAGVVVLGSQAVDGAAAISARARTGKTDYGSSVLKRTPRAYLGYKTDGDVLFRTITSEDAARTYRLSHNDVTGFQQRRVPVGKGPKSRYWQFEVENENGADFTVSDVLAYPQVLRRRVM